MTWIKTIAPQEADEETKRAYEAARVQYPDEYATPVFPLGDGSQNIVASHSLIPGAMHHSFAAFAAMMAPHLPLVRRQHELIATMVSVMNRCHY